jgi:hypothetical protein
MTQDVDAAQAVRPAATVMQHAIRVLVILDACGEPVTASDPQGGVVVIRAELRLQALDFWLRNPDYLAGELLTMIEEGRSPASDLAVVERLLQDPEPDLHWYPMPRWHYGAYEALDDAFSVLSAYGLAFVRRLGGVKKPARSQFFLTQAGRDAVVALAAEPVLAWYGHQVRLVAVAAGADVGSALKARQYRQAEYANTELGVNIAPIHALVRARLADVNAAGGSSIGAPEGGRS